MSIFTLTVKLPGSHWSQRFTLSGASRFLVAQQAAAILRRLAASRGVNVFALDYQVAA